MSHHFDYPTDETLDISDAYCFAGASDRDGPRTVFGMNASPTYGKPWNPAGYYELRLDTNGDFVEDITWRFRFPVDSSGTQHVQVEQLTGAAATDRTAKGKIITPPNAPVGQVLNLAHGIKVFAGQRRDSFFNYIPLPSALREALFNGTYPDMASLLPAHDDFMNTSVRSILLEAPTGITGTGRLHYWATTAIYDEPHSAWFTLQRAAGPLINVVYNWAGAGIDYNAAVPTDELKGRPANPTTDPASGIWGLMRNATAAVVAAGDAFSQGSLGRPTALAYGALVADTLLPNVLSFTPGTNALWDPWRNVNNGKGLTEQGSDNMIDMVLNQDFSSRLQHGPLLDHFPYLTEPPTS